eukprot:1844473-Amphidinium_carterae.1
MNHCSHAMDVDFFCSDRVLGLVSRLTKGMDVISAQRVVIKPSKWILMPHSRARVMWDAASCTAHQNSAIRPLYPKT